MLTLITKSTVFQQNATQLVVALAAAVAVQACGGEPSSDDRDRADLVREQQRLREEQRRTQELQRELDAARAREQQARRTQGRTAGEAKRDPGTLLTAADARSFEQLAGRLGGESGLAVSGLGRAQRPELLGDLRTGPAWSTIKVPIAVAVAREGLMSGALLRTARAAITASDNAAAERLWAALGAGSAAGASVEEVLADTGDRDTRVETRRVRPGFTPFGQTEWPLNSQQRFVAGLSCLSDEAAAVLDLMEQVIPSQRWGIGDLGLGTQLKGGWGPDPGGSYLVRQMGAVLLEGGKPMALSIITRPADGTLEGGIRNVRAIARWAVEHVASARLPAEPRC